MLKTSRNLWYMRVRSSRKKNLAWPNKTGEDFPGYNSSTAKNGQILGAESRTRMVSVGKCHGGIQSIEPLTSDEWEFANAMQQYSEITHHRFPTWSEALHVLIGLGYHK